MHSETYGSVFALSCCEYQLQEWSLASTAIVVSLAPAGPTTPTEQMRKDRSRARCNLCAAESLKQHFRSRVMDGFVSGGAFNRRAARQRLHHPDMGLIKRSKAGTISRFCKRKLPCWPHPLWHRWRPWPLSPPDAGLSFPLLCWTSSGK